jgi:hypothetical protein
LTNLIVLHSDPRILLRCNIADQTIPVFRSQHLKNYATIFSLLADTRRVKKTRFMHIEIKQVAVKRVADKRLAAAIR